MTSLRTALGLALALSLVAAGGCGSEDESTSPIPSKQDVKQARQKRGSGGSKAGAPAGPARGGSRASGSQPQGPGPVLRKPKQPKSRKQPDPAKEEKTKKLTKEEAKDVAANAVKAAREAKGSHCAKAFEAVKSAVGATHPGGGSAGRETFMQGCQSMPSSMQKCLDPSYAADHHEQCNELRTQFGK
jgi:hypothetical protein